jgi:hypothetical protein
MIYEVFDVEQKVVLPYVQVPCEKIAKILRKKNIRTTLQLPHTTRSLLKSVKDPLDHQLHKGIYKNLYSCGLNYINETMRSCHVRIKEQKEVITHNWVKYSTLIGHSYKTKH